MRTKAVKAIVLGAGILALGACAAQYRNHGYVPSEDELSEIVVGVDTRDSVADSVGVPSAAGLLNDSGYYYVRSRVKHLGGRAPQEIERQIVAITFTSTGVVENIERFGLEDGQVVPLARRITKGGVDDVGFLKAMFGNLGGFNAGDLLGR